MDWSRGPHTRTQHGNVVAKRSALNKAIRCRAAVDPVEMVVPIGVSLSEGVSDACTNRGGPRALNNLPGALTGVEARGLAAPLTLTIVAKRSDHVLP